MAVYHISEWMAFYIVNLQNFPREEVRNKNERKRNTIELT